MSHCRITCCIIPQFLELFVRRNIPKYTLVYIKHDYLKFRFILAPFFTKLLRDKSCYYTIDKYTLVLYVGSIILITSIYTSSYKCQLNHTMLKLKLISKLLCQGLAPVRVADSQFASPVDLSNSVVSLSLLSSDGIGLTTVSNSQLLSHLDISNDNLKIYSLIGYNRLQQQLKAFYSNCPQPSSDNIPPEIDVNEQTFASWTIVKLENNLKVMIQKLSPSSNLYVTIFYHNLFPDEFAKLKIDNLTDALNEGLTGYNGWDWIRKTFLASCSVEMRKCRIDLHRFLRRFLHRFFSLFPKRAEQVQSLGSIGLGLLQRFSLYLEPQ